MSEYDKKLSFSVENVILRLSKLSALLMNIASCSSDSLRRFIIIAIIEFSIT